MTNDDIWPLFERRVASSPDRLFAVDEFGTECTFAQARTSVLGMAGRLAASGVGAGTVVSWQLPNWLEALHLTLALSRLQATQNPIVSILRAREVGFITRQAQSSVLIVPDRHGEFDYVAMARELAATQPGLSILVARDDLLNGPQVPLAAYVEAPSTAVRWLFYTSGTTADPKGVCHTDASVIAGAVGFVKALTITPDDRVSLILPVTHIGGIIHVLATLLTGAPMIAAASFHPEHTVRYLRDQGATTLPGGMPFIHAYFAFQHQFPEVAPLFPVARLLAHGGAPKPPSLHYEAKRRLGTAGIVSGYGMTECPMAIWNRPEDSDQDLANTEGCPVPGVEMRVVTAAGVLAEVDEEGEVRVRGPQLMQGYVDQALNLGALDADGFFRSGDLGTLDTSGRLTITGRLKDIIIRNMENISARELENLLHAHPGVSEVAVIGLPDALTGERVCAVVVARDSASPPTCEELCAYLLDCGLSTRKLPERLEIVSSLPRNAMEKILKNELRARFSTEINSV